MADAKIRGITIQIGGDTSGLKKELGSVNKELNDTQKQLKDVEKLLKLDPTNTELLKQKQELLGRAIGDSKNKLDELKKVQDQMDTAGIDKSSDQYMALQREIVATTNQIKELEKQADASNVVLQKIGATAKEIGEGADKIASATKGISTAAGAALAAGGAVAGKAVSGYADREQLAGGIEKLFGEDASKTVLANAENAYKTAGLSANEYLETMTSFSASLISSLEGDTKEAARLSDVAIRSMSDNANTFGTDISSLQLAYKNFARGNFTMLDNLSLGYSGTKEGMEKLLADANAYNKTIGKNTKYQLDSYADIINAIEDIQTMQNIAGTTAKEAAGTVSGSIATAKSSLDNLIAGLGDPNADIEQLTANVIEAVQNVAANVIPVLRQIWDNIPTGAKIGIEMLAIVAAISPVASAVSNVSNAISIISTKVLPGLGSAISWIAANPIVLIIAAIVAVVALIATKGDEIQALLGKLDDWLQGVFTRDWTETFGPVLGGILNGFFDIVSTVWNRVKEIFNGIIDFIRGVFTGDWERAWNGVKEMFNGIFGSILDLAAPIINGVIGLINGAIDGINWLIRGMNLIPGVSIKELGHLSEYEVGSDLLSTGAPGASNSSGSSKAPGLTAAASASLTSEGASSYYNQPINVNVELDGRVVGSTIATANFRAGVANG